MNYQQGDYQLGDKQAGFTLIELAIVLVIIGLLLAGVLKGQELINNARIKNITNDLKAAQVALFGYQDRFRTLPGDDAAVVAHVNGTLASTGGTVGNGLIEGAWNSSTQTDESFLFWQHIRLAGLSQGTALVTDSNYSPLNASGGRMGIQSTPASAITGLNGSYVACTDIIAGKYARQLDINLDDGVSNTGSVMAVARSGGASAVTGTAGVTPATSYVDTTDYTVCLAF